MVRALGLLSGGLDSILAVKVLQEQGIKVTAVSFVTPFFNAKNASRFAKILNIELVLKDITEEHLKVVSSPKHGYGSGMNPCIDCHALMLKIAGDIMLEKGLDFIFTGEVLGERPMSQNKRSLQIVAEESGYADYILRPLSARLLPETKPEKESKVDRMRLLDISGRQRKIQFEMAKRYGIKNAPNPAGGCLLTDPTFSERLRDLMNKKEIPTIHDIKLLKVGRHVRLDENSKIVIGRNKDDNKTMSSMENKGYAIFSPRGVRGPHCMVPRGLAGDFLEKAIKMCASYCDAKEGEEIRFSSGYGIKKRNVKTTHSKAYRPKEFIGS